MNSLIQICSYIPVTVTNGWFCKCYLFTFKFYSFNYSFLINHSNLSLHVHLYLRSPRLTPAMCGRKRTSCMSIINEVRVSGYWHCYLRLNCRHCAFILRVKLKEFNSWKSNLRKQRSFRDATGFRAKWRLRNERRNSILMTCNSQIY